MWNYNHRIFNNELFYKMFRILIIPCIGIVVLLQFRLNKENKTYNVVERESSFYIDTNGTIEEYINKQININRYEH